jgi:Domain of unknown function (DUF1931)
MSPTGRREGERTLIMSVPRLHRFFRAAAGLDVDKDDLKRYSDFVHARLYDLLVMAEATAKANGRDVIESWDLPITKGLQECSHQFAKLDHEIELQPILDRLAEAPQLDLTTTEETDRRLPLVAGGLSVALARSFAIIDPKLVNPSTADWNRAFALFDVLL